MLILSIQYVFKIYFKYKTFKILTKYACPYFKLSNSFIYIKMRFGRCMSSQSTNVRCATL